MPNSKREQFIAAALSSDLDECIVWPFAVRKSSGYCAHNIRYSGKKYNVDAHRYVCREAHGAPDEGQQAAHRCGNKLCVNPNHLYWADPTTNMADAREHGTLRGGGRYRQRFFEAEISEICRSSESLAVLAARFGTDQSYISRLRRLHGNPG